MTIISKKCVLRKRAEHTYEVLVNEWENTPENLETVYNACDKWNWGGYLFGVEKVENGYLLTVNVFID